MKRVYFCIALLGALTASPAHASDDKALDKPPAGLSATSATLSQILRNYTDATGKRPVSMADTSSEQWTFSKAGLAGTETLIRGGLDFYSRIAAGPLVEEYGQFVGHRWHRDQNGVVSPVLSHDSTSFEMLLFMSSLNDAADPKNDVSVLGEAADPQGSYVVSVKLTGEKHPEFVYYDKQSGLIDRISYVIDGRRDTVSYGDYRKTSGLAQPWHVHFTDGTAALDDDFKRTALTVGGDVNTMQFTMPASTLAFQTFSGRQKLPAKVYWNTWRIDVGNDYAHDAKAPTLVVRVNVNGRGLDFAVSAGEPTTLIDYNVAQELGLSSFGQVTKADGKAVSYDTILPDAQIGGLTLHKLAVRAVSFHYHISDETKIVGIIGYDVLSSGVFKIDYDNGTFDLIPAKEFDNNPMGGDSYTLPVLFDSGYPFFQGSLDSHISNNILFDNDFEMSFVFGGFTDKYPESIKDVVTGKGHGNATIPFADSNGFGKDVSVWLGKVPDIEFGPAHFVNFQIVAADGAVSYGGHEVDAVMGGDFLQFYDIYLDYPHNRIFLKPNASFFKNFKIQP